jgi:hypothetical protein
MLIVLYNSQNIDYILLKIPHHDDGVLGRLLGNRKSLLSAFSFSRSDRPRSLNKDKSGIRRIRFPSLALVNIRLSASERWTTLATAEFS